MKILNILVILILVTLLFGQSGKSISPDVMRVKDMPARQNNIIDMQLPAQKVKAQPIANITGENWKKHQVTGSAKTSGPAQVLQNDSKKVLATDSELKQHLGDVKLLKPAK